MKCITMSMSHTLEVSKKALLPVEETIEVSTSIHKKFIQIYRLHQFVDTKTVDDIRNYFNLACMLLAEILMKCGVEASTIIGIVGSSDPNIESGVTLTPKACMVMGQRAQECGSPDVEKWCHRFIISKLVGDCPEHSNDLLSGFLVSVIRMIKLLDDSGPETDLEVKWKDVLDAVQYVTSHRQHPGVSDHIGANWDQVRFVHASDFVVVCRVSRVLVDTMDCHAALECWSGVA
jgi:hypothetical protein